VPKSLSAIERPEQYFEVGPATESREESDPGGVGCAHSVAGGGSEAQDEGGVEG
jgi:hypothetical protein